jgi:hypothetical protein
MKVSILEGFAGQSVRLAVLPILLVGLASVSQAQASGAAAPSTTKAAAPATAPEKPAAHGESQPRGNHEGIKVHGHWTIEVRNPDGTLATHREFENSLSSGFSFFTYALPGGSSMLSGLITGQVPTPVAWGIVLEGPSYPSVTNAPCSPTISLANANIGMCLLLQNSSSSYLATDEAYCPNPPAGMSCNLVPSTLGTAPSYTGIQLLGSVTATQAGSVSTVATLDVNACGLTGSATNCISPSSHGMLAFTSLTLNGSPGTPTAPVSVSAGQTIGVTVQFSFQ